GGAAAAVEQQPRRLDARGRERRVAAEEAHPQHGGERAGVGRRAEPPGQQTDREARRHVDDERADGDRQTAASLDRRVDEEPRGGTEAAGEREHQDDHDGRPRRARRAATMPSTAAATPTATDASAYATAVGTASTPARARVSSTNVL